MYRTSRINNAPVVASQHDYDRDQIKRELNSLRRNVHDLCTRSGTSFDCNKFLRSDDMTPVVTTITPKRTADYKITEYVGDVKTIKPSDRPLVESGPLMREAAKYGECIV
ncbi:hypothetical protein QKT50_gp003 [Rachiplusia ou multiple nucleopolyhedrovirus]|uniref:Uncharacterized protein n=3 Tax=Alphabaculovirus TaxID=558016 RepID=Q773J2_NPVR1|nr:hypothetical protein QKT50_gp003 [Rachiplusia ou multiple nucleopolyhedrovirus]AAB53354.1 ORF 327 [Anagrapha falcifera MNPV]AAC33755.1 unknown [Rachiplusia ou multiple nucleopolyhedrovirus]AAN28124.1 unknown [Rachiplusia ou multiple nucleopolyhedrovirus]